MKLQKKTNWRPSLEILEARRLLSIYADFNGDGFDDLAIGAPGEDLGTATDAGIVQVIYGSATGLATVGSSNWSQSILGTDSDESGDNFGASLAAGDFNNDGRDDLAVGVPGEDFPPVGQAGAVHVIYGSATGLTAIGSAFFHQDTNRVRDSAETDDLSGKSLAAGDFNADGFADLGVGVPEQDLPDKTDAGAVHIFYGGGAGLKPPGNQTFNMDHPSIPGSAAAGDEFGAALAAGDFNGDGRDDLAIGAPFAKIGTAIESGTFSTLLGSAVGLSATGSQSLGSSDAGAQNGTALAAGDFNGDGRDDLATGAPFGTLGTGIDSGLVWIYQGVPAGLSLNGQIYQSFFGHTNESGDQFGSALTAGDFDNDGFRDLAIGVPGEDHSTFTNNGSVLVAFGSSIGITPTGDVIINQADVPNNEESADHFGEVLAAGDFNGNGAADIAIGTPDEDVGAVGDAGAVYVLYGGAIFTGGQTWTQDTAGIGDTVEAGDNFGGGLDANGGKSAPDGGSGRRDLAQLISADFELESLLTKPNKRRLLNGRR